MVAVGAMLVLLASFASIPAVFASPHPQNAQQLFSVTGNPGAITEITSSTGVTQALHAPGMQQFTIPDIYQGMSQVRYFQVQGQIQADGRYHYPITVHMAQGALVAALEVAENPDANTEVIAVGVQGYDAVQPLTTTSSANLATVWYDPANLQLVQVFDYLTWTWTGTSVTSSSARYPATILYPDGWVIVPPGESHNSGHGSGGAYALTDGIYYNAVFCGGGQYAEFVPTQVYGLANGTRSYTVDTYKSGSCKSGSCSNLLHWGAHFN
jgi:hypothetical protein